MQDAPQKRKSFFDLIISPLSFSDFSAQLSLADSSHIELTNSASGHVVPIVHGRLLHSRYDPKKEAARRFDVLLKDKGHHLVVLSFDFLYGVEYWVNEKSANDAERKSKSNYHLLLVVQDWAMLDAFIINRDWSFLSFFQSVELIYLGDANWRNLVEKSFLKWCRQSFSGVIFFQKDKGDDHQDKDSLAEFKKYLLQMISNHFSNHLTRYVFEKKWFLNTFLNLIAGENHRFAGSLFPKLAEKSDEKNLAVLVLSGPSLDEQMDELAMLPMEKITLVAADSAVPILSARGIVPDMVVAVDGGYYNALDLCYSPSATVADDKPDTSTAKTPTTASADDPSSDAPTKKTLLLSSVFVHPLLLRYAQQQNYGVPCFFCLRKEDALWRNFLDGNSSEPLVFQSSSVALIAIDIIRKLNFKNVVVYGLDACYPFFHGHASASTHDRYYTNRANRYHPREQGDFLSIVEYAKKIERGDEKKLYDIPSLQRFRNELVDYFSHFSKKKNQILKLFIRSPYFPWGSTSEDSSNFSNNIFLSKDSSEVLSMVKISKKLEGVYVTQKKNVEKKSNTLDDWVAFSKTINLFREKLNRYRGVSGEEQKQLAAEIDALLEGQFPFLKTVVDHHRELLSVKGDAPHDLSKKRELTYYEVLILFFRMQRYFSSMLR